MNINFRELLDDIAFLRNFAMINGNNEVGQKLNKVLDYSSNWLAAEKKREEGLIKEIEKCNKAFKTNGKIVF